MIKHSHGGVSVTNISTGWVTANPKQAFACTPTGERSDGLPKKQWLDQFASRDLNRPETSKMTGQLANDGEKGSVVIQHDLTLIHDVDDDMRQKIF